jgi:hypothetical protein
LNLEAYQIDLSARSQKKTPRKEENPNSVESLIDKLGVVWQSSEKVIRQNNKM